MNPRKFVVLAGASLLGCTHPNNLLPQQPWPREGAATPTVLLAQACTPGMSCFGRIVLLPNGEVVDAAVAATTAAAATAATVRSGNGSRTKPKSADKTKAEPITQLKRRVTCELVGGNVKQPGKKIRCSYHCPGDAPGVTHNVFLDIPECPMLWDFYL